MRYNGTCATLAPRPSLRTAQMIFPGMDPYLEDPALWPGFHNALIVYIRDHLHPQLRPRYIASIEERVFVEGPGREVVPDVFVRRGSSEGRGRPAALLEADEPLVERVAAIEAHESFIEILDMRSGRRVVTVIEGVSPSNKYPGPGRDLYLAKQRELLTSETHLVEIDLLRFGRHVLAVPESRARARRAYHYLVNVNRAANGREEHEFYPRQLSERLPKVRIPLADEDPDAVLDLQAVVAQACEAGGYEDLLDYAAPCQPPLSAEEQTWANGQLAVRRG
jgi:hypothetical protein